MKAFLFIFLLYPQSYSLAFDSNNLFQDDKAKVQQAIQNPQIDSAYERRKESTFQKFSKDPDNRVSKKFAIPKYFKTNVEFWYNIYTLFDSNHVVVHDKRNLKIVYDILNFSELSKKSVNIHVKNALQSNLSLKRAKEIKKLLNELATKKKPSHKARQILSRLKDLNIKVPRKRSQKKKFFQALAKNIRTQTGQRDNIYNGIKNFLPYSKFIYETFDGMKLPRELLAVPFLESSFNTRAHSRVGAVGVWQFMRRTARVFMKVDKFQDGRRNPNLSTVSALHLLAQNRQILKRWDLAVTAYNSGTKHIIKARRKLKDPKMSLEKMLRSYKHPHLGFASLNFYSEFLALVYTLAYQDEIYSLTKKEHDVPQFKAFISKCAISPSYFFRNIKKIESNSRAHNKHFKKKSFKRKLPKGTIFFSSKDLNKRKYYQVSQKEMRRNYPKYWSRLVKNQSCSTK